MNGCRPGDWPCAAPWATTWGPGSASNQAIAKIGPAIQWQHSYVAGDRTFCIYLADSEATIRQHAELSGIPVAQITEISQIIDPTTANN